jgi:hypothetical protein
MEECICDRRIGHEMKDNLMFSIDELRNRTTSSIRVTHGDLEAREISKLRFKELPPQVPAGLIEERDIKAPRTFLSDNRHSNTTPVDFSEKVGPQRGSSRPHSQGHKEAFVEISADATSPTVGRR